MKSNTILKRLTALFTLIAAATMVAMAVENKPMIQFADKQHDFGNIQEAKGPVTCEFEFTNIGNAPLVIVSATASCGCTRPQYPVEPVKPGKKGKVKVTYNPKHRPGEFDKVVKLRTYAKNGKKVNLRIKGVVIPENSK